MVVVSIHGHPVTVDPIVKCRYWRFKPVYNALQ